MAPGQILIELVLPIVSVAATILGAFIVKKRRDRKKAEACKTDNLHYRVESLEQKLTTLTDAYVVDMQHIKAKTDNGDRQLRSEIESVNERVTVAKSEMAYVPSKGEMERHVDQGCKVLRAEFQTLIADANNSLQDDLENKMIDTARKIGEDAEHDVEIGMVDVRKEINKKIQEYDLAITKWVKKTLEDKMTAPSLAATCSPSDDIEPDDDDLNP